MHIYIHTCTYMHTHTHMHMYTCTPIQDNCRCPKGYISRRTELFRSWQPSCEHDWSSLPLSHLGQPLWRASGKWNGLGSEAIWWRSYVFFGHLCVCMFVCMCVHVCVHVCCVHVCACVDMCVYVCMLYLCAWHIQECCVVLPEGLTRKPIPTPDTIQCGFCDPHLTPFNVVFVCSVQRVGCSKQIKIYRIVGFLIDPGVCNLEVC